MVGKQRQKAEGGKKKKIFMISQSSSLGSYAEGSYAEGRRKEKVRREKVFYH
ncbi:MAG: hypothetical protein F6K17_05770 [Okeania sp. SIO3C4]|nr:hypothetical protein [Okeania sp. SIO3C4]